MIISVINSLYTQSSGYNEHLVFGACQRRSCINMTITDDEILEDNESYEVTLQRTPDLDNRIILAPMIAEINIIDDDGKLEVVIHGMIILHDC